MKEKIVARGLYKIFGRKPEAAMEMLRKGQHKDEIFQQTGMVVGVQDASFAVHEGEIFVLMGLSGSGKSTLIRLLNRLVEPTAGQVLVDGVDVATLNSAQLVALRRRDMAMVFQSFALLPHLTVLGNTAFGLEIAGEGRKARERRALQVLEEVGLGAFANKRPHELSGGMQQRVGLARALAVNPSLLLMDEAFSALDPLKRTEMQELLLTLQKEHKRTIVFVSHDLDEALRIGNRIAIMEGGRIVQIGAPGEILRHPADAYVRAFFQGVDVRRYLTARDVARPDEVMLLEAPADVRAGFESAIGRLRQMHRNYGFVLDPERRVRGTVSIDSMRRSMEEGNATLERALLDDIRPIPGDTPLNDLIAHIVRNPCPLPVIDAERRYIGAVTQTILLRHLAQDAAGR